MCQQGVHTQIGKLMAFFWGVKIMCMYMCHVRYIWRSEEDIGCPGAVLIGSCKPPDVGVRNGPQVLWKRSTYS